MQLLQPGIKAFPFQLPESQKKTNANFERIHSIKAARCPQCYMFVVQRTPLCQIKKLFL